MEQERPAASDRGAEALRRQRRNLRILLILAGLVSLLALIQGQHRSRKGRNALLKWAPVFEAVEQGEPIYGVGEEGYPTLPITLLLMAPFHALGPLPGAFAWALARILLAWWLVWKCLQLPTGRARDVPWIAQAAVFLLCARILHSEIQHANINLWVAACVMAATVGWARGRAGASGFWMGLGAGLKVTPALGLVLFAKARSLRGLAGLAAGLTTAIALPAVWLGARRTWDMTQAWGEQMLLPYLQGRELGLRQTEHINQSLLGLLGRWTTDGVAIPARESWPTEAVRIGLFDLGPEAFRNLHLAVVVLVLAGLWWALPRRCAVGQRPVLALGSFAAVGLAMLLLSERSWKHHHVLFPLAGTYLALVVWPPLGWPSSSARARAWAGGALGFAILCVLGSGEGVLGKRGADWAEAFGAYTWATLAMFVVLLGLLRSQRAAVADETVEIGA